MPPPPGGGQKTLTNGSHFVKFSSKIARFDLTPDGGEALMLNVFVAIYLLASIGIGLYAARRVHSSKDYVVAGRSLSFYITAGFMSLHLFQLNLWFIVELSSE